MILIRRFRQHAWQKKLHIILRGAAGYYGGLLAAAARAPKLVRSCTFRVAQLPKLLEIALGFLRQEVARLRHRDLSPGAACNHLIARAWRHAGARATAPPGNQ